MQKMNRKGALPLIALIVLAVGALMYFGYINLGTITGSGSYIERPIFKYVQCEPNPPTFTTNLYPTISEGGQWLSPKPTLSDTDKYTVTFVNQDSGYGYIEYYVCNSQVLSNSNCRLGKPDTTGGVVANIKSTYQGGIVQITDISPREYVWAQYQSPCLNFKNLRCGKQGAQFQYTFIPYHLIQYDPFSGKQVLNPNGCSSEYTEDSYRDRFLSSNSKKVNAVMKAGGSVEKDLKAGEFRNFVSGYVTSAEPSFKLTYSGQDAWCKPGSGSATIFKINTVTVGSGTYKIASVDYSDELGTVTCCPGDKKPGYACTSNFEWKSTEVTNPSTGETNVQCSAFNPCDGGEWSPYSSKTIARYTCQDGKCVQKTESVQCSTVDDCGVNQVCDRGSWQCINANTNLKGQELDILIDDPQDCQAKGGVWVQEQTEQKRWWNYVGIGEPKIITRSYCDTSNLKVLPYIIGALILIALIFFAKPLIMGAKALTRRFI